MKRFIYEELFKYILYDLVKPELDRNNGVYINDVFELRDYSYDTEVRHNDEPNFYHKPSGFMMWWYKYPLRDAITNMELSYEDFASVLYDARGAYESHGIFFVSYGIGNTMWWLPSEDDEDNEDEEENN